MFLHEDEKLFKTAINLAVEQKNMPDFVIEKDYYVTMILLLLSRKLPFVVFKGGTSLSKCHNVIKRFSEDIDITIDTSLSQGQKRKLKYALVEVAEELGMSILNLDMTRSRWDYNRYEIAYESVIYIDGVPSSGVVLLETSFMAVSFPTVSMPVTNYIGEVMQKETPEKIAEYHLEPFEMKVQGIERTLVDKVFAICDYYLQKRIKKHSRHIYDIYKLLPLIEMDESLGKLVDEVREVRKCVDCCPSALDNADIPSLLQIIIQQQVYKEDYQNVTEALLEEEIDYDTAIEAVNQILISGLFK